MHLRPWAVFLLLPLAGCLGGPLGWDDEQVTPCDAVDSGEFPRDVLVTTGEGAALWRFQGTYREAEAREGPVTHAAAGAGVALWGDGTLRVFDRDLRTLASRAVEDVTTMAWHRGHLWVVHDWVLSAYTPHLEEVGRLTITPPHPYGTKVIDLAVGQGGKLFLVDDVVSPFYAFVVDVRRPEQPALEATVEWEGQSPAWQWVREDTGQWWIEDGWSGYGGGSSAARSFVHDGNDWQDGPRLPLGSRPAPDSDRSRTGVFVAATTAVLPAWAVLQEAKGTTLAQVDVVDGALEQSCRVRLDMDGGRPAVDGRGATVAVGSASGSVQVFRAGPAMEPLATWEVDGAVRYVFVL